MNEPDPSKARGGEYEKLFWGETNFRKLQQENVGQQREVRLRAVHLQLASRRKQGRHLGSVRFRWTLFLCHLLQLSILKDL